MKLNKAQKSGIFISVFILVWALLNLAPIGIFSVNGGVSGYSERYCTLNYFSCFSEFGDGEGYPKFLSSNTSIIFVILVFPIVLTILIGMIIIKKLSKWGNRNG